MDNNNISGPNLINTGLTVEDIQNKSLENQDVDAVIKNFPNLRTTESDFNFAYFANSEKLKSREDIIPMDKSKIIPPNPNPNPNPVNYPDPNPNPDNPDPGPPVEKIDDYMVNPRQPPPPEPPEPPSKFDKSLFESEEEELLAKLDMLRKLGELTQYGIKLSQNYNMKSDYRAMKYEFELHRSIKDKSNGVKWLSNMMINICWGMELANESFNPFDFKLKGWSEQMSSDVDDYYDVLGELYEKYFQSGKPIPPELKLVMMFGGSAIKFHLAQASLGKIPDLRTALSKNPALAKKLNQQAQAESNPVFQKQTKEHELANKKVADIDMLRRKEIELEKIKQQRELEHQQMLHHQLLMENRMAEKQRQLELLRNQLNQTRSDSRSVNLDINNNNPIIHNLDNQPTMAQPSIPLSVVKRFKTTKIPKNPKSNPDIINPQDIINSQDNIPEIIPESANIQINPNLDNILEDKFNDTLTGKSGSTRSSRPRRRAPRKIPELDLKT